VTEEDFNTEIEQLCSKNHGDKSQQKWWASSGCEAFKKTGAVLVDAGYSYEKIIKFLNACFPALTDGYGK
jgi:hypothetical protein